MSSKKSSLAQLIFPNQLFRDTDYLDKNQPVFLVEEFLFFRQYKFHKQKIALHRASMKFYEAHLVKKKFRVIYIESTSPLSDIRKLIKHLEREKFDKILVTDVCDNWLEKRINQTKLEIQTLESPIFINTKEELKEYFEGKENYHQTDFYKQQRISRNILLKNGKPVGGKWTYDTENRKKYPKKKKSPAVHFPENNKFYDEAKKYVENNFSDNYGNLTSYQLYPVTFDEADNWFNQFLEMRFYEFGIYEDSIVEHDHFLHHSILSPLLNTGLLTASKVLYEAIDYAAEFDIPINSLEGFVRQILGWREFVRAIYLYQGNFQRTKNYWHHDNLLPASFYTAKTNIKPIDSTILKVLETGYAHHIERLMIFANCMNLLKLNPDTTYQWFMEMFIDSYDWVMVPNVYGMSSFADGGKMSTKPYISGSNYIKKMSDYEDGEWSQKWDALFWNFVNDNRTFFETNPRLGMMLKTLDKMTDEKRSEHFRIAKTTIKELMK